jgi:hypothetical protein
MTRTEATMVTTTAVPMRGYEEALLGAGGCGTRLYDLSHTIQARLRLGAREAPCLGGLARLQGCGRRYYYMKELQVPAIRCLSLPSRWEPAPEPDDDLRLDCGDRRYLDAVRSAYLSFLLAGIQACAEGEPTKPIILRGQAGVGGKIDLRSGTWIVQSKVGLQDQELPGALDVLIHCRRALDVRALLEEVYDLGQRDLQAATDKVFDTIDRLLCEGQEEVCDQILASVDVARLPTALMRSFLTITAAAKEKLPARQALFREIECEMTRLRGPDVTRRLLGNLA